MTQTHAPIGAAANGYRGRFAPTPSGPLHLGSLLTALASFLQARCADGVWLLRIDDLDVLRSRAEAADTILHQLEAHGLCWDERVRRQSRFMSDYQAAYAQLDRSSRLYDCYCTRAELAANSLAGPDGPVYAGTCRGRREFAGARSVRLETSSGRLELDDPWQGMIERDLSRDVGDFVLRRSDGQIGYQLACVVDEAAQGITEVVRGSDLIGSSLRQIHLQRLLELRSPGYRHLPVLTGDHGRKLSKQNHAAPLENDRAVLNLFQCLQLLGQEPPAAFVEGNVDDALTWAIAHWHPATIPRKYFVAAPN